MPVPFDADYAELSLSQSQSIQPHQLEGSFGGFRSRRQKECLLEISRRHIYQLFQVFGAKGVGVYICVDQVPVQCFPEPILQVRVGVPCVGNKYRRGEIDPPIPRNVVHVEVLRPVPDDRHLPVHGPGFVAIQVSQDRFRPGSGNRGMDRPVPGAYLRNIDGSTGKRKVRHGAYPNSSW